MILKSESLQNPKAYFGFQPGSDKRLINYEQLIAYFQMLSQSSAGLYMEKIGFTPNGKPMYTAFISSSENIKTLARLKEINRRLTLDNEIAPQERKNLIEKGRLFLMLTLSMHATEVGLSQAVPIYTWELLTIMDPQQLDWLEKVVLMVIPCHNPDGMDMVVQHYNKSFLSKIAFISAKKNNQSSRAQA